MTVTDTSWRGEADRLRAEGLTIRQIAARVGMAHGTVGEHFKPALCGCGNRRGHGKRCCLECATRRRREARQATEGVLVRMWADGATSRQIADAVGYRQATVRGRVSQLRARGVNLPLRRPDLVEHARTVLVRHRAPVSGASA